jgi:hypothetical protein
LIASALGAGYFKYWYIFICYYLRGAVVPVEAPVPLVVVPVDVPVIGPVVVPVFGAVVPVAGPAVVPVVVPVVGPTEVPVVVPVVPFFVVPSVAQAVNASNEIQQIAINKYNFFFMVLLLKILIYEFSIPLIKIFMRIFNKIYYNIFKFLKILVKLDCFINNCVILKSVVKNFK